MAISEVGLVSNLHQDKGSNLSHTEEWMQVTAWIQKRSPSAGSASTTQYIRGFRYARPEMCRWKNRHLGKFSLQGQINKGQIKQGLVASAVLKPALRRNEGASVPLSKQQRLPSADQTFFTDKFAAFLDLEPGMLSVRF